MVGRTDYLPAGLQVGTNLCVVQRGLVGEVQNLDIAEKSVKGRLVLLTSRRHLDPEQESETW